MPFMLPEQDCFYAFEGAAFPMASVPSTYTWSGAGQDDGARVYLSNCDYIRDIVY
jgi:hypothetical protein